MPTSPKSMPSSTMRMDLAVEPPPRMIAATSPISISEKYSGELKRSASCESGVLMAATSSVANVPAMNEPMAAMPSALPALPCLAS